MGFVKQNLVIAAGEKYSDELELAVLERVQSLSIQAPAALSGTISLQSADEPDGSRWTGVQSPPGTDITVPAGKSVVLTDAPFPRLRLATSVASEAAERVFAVWMELKDAAS